MSLPTNWDRMTLDALWNTLNDPRRHPTPRATVEAIMFAVRQRGIGALEEPATLQRLATCDEIARAEISQRIEHLFAETSQ